LYCNGEEFCDETVDACDHRNAPTCPDDGLYCTAKNTAVRIWTPVRTASPACPDDSMYCNGEEYCE
jgi:hypothetical protein